MKVGLFIDQIERLNINIDSSCRLAAEAERRGAKIYYMNINDIYTEDGEVFADVSQIGFEAEKGLKNSFYYITEQEVLNLADLDVLLIRKDPPITQAHYAALYILEALRDKVFMVNDPVGIRNGHSKLQTLRFPQFLPTQMIAANKKQVRRFLDKHEDIIMKPINSMGGQGVIRLKKGETNLNSLIETMLRLYDGQLMLQTYIEDAHLGEKRIFLFNGEPYAAIVKKPKEGDFRGNISAGATLEEANLTAREKEICETLKPYLLENRLFYVGLDVLGGYILEINSISPGAISWANQILDTPLEKTFWDVLIPLIKS
ncbi:MAG: glutathione synthase [Rickettsiales bacterium]|nr:glutathione synthase [Rickettsiales bacterium]